MNNILSRKECNMFSLSAVITNEDISAEQAKDAFEQLVRSHRGYFEKEYEEYKEECSEKFEILYANIQEECKKFEDEKKKDYMKEYGFFSCAFLADLVGIETLYSEPDNLVYHMYHEIGLEHDAKNILKEKIENPTKITLDNELDTEEYSELKSYLKKIEVGFMTHCTEGPLQKTLYFELNEQTKRWLLKYPSDFSITGKLQDLALYQDEKIVFSSCTHEKDHLFFTL